MLGDGSASCCADKGWLPSVRSTLRRATRAVLLEFQPLVDAQPKCQRRACLADSRPLQRRQLPDVPLGPRSARVTWGHSLPCRSEPGASAAATAAPRSSEPLAARVSTQTTAALLSVPMDVPILWFLKAGGPHPVEGLPIPQPQSSYEEESEFQGLAGELPLGSPAL